MITAVDTNVLLDILIPNAKYARASKRLLDEALAQGALVISEVVYAELASQFPTKQELERFLADTQIRLVSSSPEALLAAYLERFLSRCSCADAGGSAAHPRPRLLQDIL